MTKKQKKLMSELSRIAEGPVAWDFANVDVDAIKLALAEIERLTAENADLKTKLERESTEELTKKSAELAIQCVESQCEVKRLKLRVNTLLAAMRDGGFLLWEDDGKQEVME